jgi:hypothetical protein
MMEKISDLRRVVQSGSLFDPTIFSRMRAVGLNFFRYLKSLGMSGEPNLVVLSSKDNYSCDKNDLKNVRILVNLKKLNLIKHLDLFLISLVRILPPDTNFVGYFSDVKKENLRGINSASFLRLWNRILNFFGSRTNHIMNRNDVTELLERNGFKTLNMKEMNGLTYFISQNISMPL